MKRILYVRSCAIYNDSRAYKEILSLLKHEYYIIVVGWDKEGNPKSKCEEVFKDFKDKIEFHFFEEKVSNSKLRLNSVFKILGWYKYVVEHVQSKKDELYAVYACDLIAGFPCKRALRKTITPFIYDIYDYFYDSHDSIPVVARKILECLEISTINHSDLCVICTEERRVQLKKSNPSKVVVIHNSPDVKEYQIEGNVRNNIDYFYCGAFSDNRLISEILGEYGNHSDMVFCFAGTGQHKQEVEINASKYDNFAYIGAISYDKCLEIESGALCLSAIYNPSIKNHQLCAPNKFYEALALGKPVIVCKGTGIDRIVEANKLGLVINYDVREFYQAIEYFKMNPDFCIHAGRNGRKLYLEAYSWEIMEERLLNSIRELGNKS